MNRKVYGSYDVLVAGGGPAGIVAAIAAAREGARVLLAEQNGFLGGLAATGLPLLSFHSLSGTQVFAGIAQEMVDRLQSMGGSLGHVRGGADAHVGTMTPIYPEVFKLLAENLVEEAGVDVLLHAKVMDACLEEAKVTGVLLAAKEGVLEVRADVTVDATGDADVLAHAGGGFAYGRDKDGRVQSMTTLFTLCDVDVDEAARHFPKEIFRARRPGESGEAIIHIAGSLGPWRQEAGDEYPFPDEEHALWAMCLHPGELKLNLTDIIEGDSVSSSGYTRAEQEGRRQAWAAFKFLKKYVPGFAHCWLSSLSHTVGSRESRRIRGLYELSADDILSCRKFADVIARAAYCMDMHSPEGKGITFTFQKESGETYDIPYRCLIPEKIDGLVVAGRCISASHEALASTRVMAICMALGEAAGRAAALAAGTGLEPRKLKAATLQEKLKESGSLLW